MNKIKLIIILLLCFVFNSAVYATPQQYNNYVQTGYKAYQSGNYLAAIQNFNKAAKLSPKEYKIYYNLGILYSKINDFNNAELNYKKVIAINPSNGKAYLNLGELYFQNKNNNLATKYYEKAIQLNTVNYALYNNLGNCYFSSKNYKQAIVYYRKSIELEKKEEAYLNLANAFIRIDDYKQAIECYKQALTMNPQNQDAQDGLSFVSQKYSQYTAYKNFNNATPSQKAPFEVYYLVQTNSILKYNDTFDKLYEMLDYVWADDNGRILLNNIINHNIHIKVAFGGPEKTNAQVHERTTQQTVSLYGIIPIYTTNIKQEKNITVNIGEDIIHLYKQPSSSFNDNMYALMSIMHELGHAVASLAENNHKDSLEEEMTVSMIGYNFASKVITGRLLTKEESSIYSKATYKALMSDDHRRLPLYNNFRNTISKIGLNLYYYDTYSDLYRFQ